MTFPAIWSSLLTNQSSLTIIFRTTGTVWISLSPYAGHWSGKETKYEYKNN